MPDDTPSTPAPATPSMVAHWAAFLRAKVKLTPEISMTGGTALITIGDDAVLSLTFTRRKHRWLLRLVEVSRDDETVSYTPGELGKAIAALTGREPQIPASPAVSGPSGPRAVTVLREKRTTVIRV
jgi:hypothetical protein